MKYRLSILTAIAVLCFALLQVAAYAATFNTIPINGSNSFASSDESFTTSTSAATGYQAYASWDREFLYFGYAGQDIGDGACSDTAEPNCEFYELGQSIDKYIVYLIDIDPSEENGTRNPDIPNVPMEYTLPSTFYADYLVLIRTDGSNNQNTFAYNGNATLFELLSDGTAQPIENGTGPNETDSPFVLFDNNGSKYLELSLTQAVLGDPQDVQVVSFFADTKEEASYAFWPFAAPVTAQVSSNGVVTGSVTIDATYGFKIEDSQKPNASGDGNPPAGVEVVPGLQQTANLNRPFFDPYHCSKPKFLTDIGNDSGPIPFHSVNLASGSNGFSGSEIFDTSTVENAATGYKAYATWDRTSLFFGYTGSDIGGGAGAGAADFESGQSPNKWLVYFLDSDPQGNDGTMDATTVVSDVTGTGQGWTLPFAADYAIFIRTDGLSSDKTPYTGVAEMREYTNGEWVSRGPCALRIFQNDSSGFMKFGVDYSYIGNPYQVHAVSWFLDTDSEISYAYWPAEAASEYGPNGTTTNTVMLEQFYGFTLEAGGTPNASGNLNPSFATSMPQVQTTFRTYSINGTLDDHEQLPTEYLGMATTSTPALFTTWDEDNLYFSFSGTPLTGEDADFYIAIDNAPVLGEDPRNGEGSPMQPPTGVTGTATYPFSADVVVVIDGVATEDSAPQQDVGTLWTYSNGSWSSAPLNGSTVFRGGADDITEMSIPRDELGLTTGLLGTEGIPYFHLVTYINQDGNGIDQPFPTENPTGSSPTFDHFFSYYMQEGVEPFSEANRSIRTETASTLSRHLYSNVYLIGNGTWSLSKNTTVVNELFIDSDAILSVGDNANNPNGSNWLRVGRQFTTLGEFEEKEGTFFSFDPQIGFPERIEPLGGFGTPSFATTFKCDPTLYNFVQHNEIQSEDCPDDGRTLPPTRISVANRYDAREGGSSDSVNRDGREVGSFVTEAQANITVADTTVEEDAGTAVVTVTLSRQESNDVTVTFMTIDDSATANEDYMSTSGTLTFTAGMTQTTIPITIIDDDPAEQAETFFVSFKAASGASLVDDRAVVTIKLNFGPTAVGLSSADATPASILLPSLLLASVLTVALFVKRKPVRTSGQQAGK